MEVNDARKEALEADKIEAERQAENMEQQQEERSEENREEQEEKNQEYREAQRDAQKAEEKNEKIAAEKNLEKQEMEKARAIAARGAMTPVPQARAIAARGAMTPVPQARAIAARGAMTPVPRRSALTTPPGVGRLKEEVKNMASLSNTLNSVEGVGGMRDLPMKSTFDAARPLGNPHQSNAAASASSTSGDASSRTSSRSSWTHPRWRWWLFICFATVTVLYILGSEYLWTKEKARYGK